MTLDLGQYVYKWLDVEAFYIYVYAWVSIHIHILALSVERA